MIMAMWRNRPSARRLAAWHEALARNGVTPYGVKMLARCNSERSRGIVHSDEYKDRMAVLQERYNRAMEECDR